MNNQVFALKINPEYEQLLPKLSREQYDALKKSIKEEGQHYPIAYNSDLEILDGHHRYKICQELSIEPKLESEPRVFADKLDEKQFVLETNLLRRHLPVFLRIITAKPLLQIYREKAERRRLDTLPKDGEQGFHDRQNFAEHEQGKAVEQFAAVIHSNPETVRQALWLEENAPEKIPDLEKGEAISKVYKEVQFENKKAELKVQLEKGIQEPNGKYDVIVVDPPWNYGTEYDAENRRCASPYPEMPIEEIKKLELPMEENCIVWLWTTNAFLHEAYHVIEDWGLIPKAILTWAKDCIGLGSWLRNQTEHCILATKGSPKVWLTNQSTILHAKNEGHSIKPDTFYQLVDSLCIGKKLDYFARKNREGWDICGTKEFE